MKTKVTYRGTSQFNVHAIADVSYEVEGTFTDEELCENVFRVFNAPPTFLNEEELSVLKLARKAKLTSMSVGDTVVLEDLNGKRQYLCEGSGWKKIED